MRLTIAILFGVQLIITLIWNNKKSSKLVTPSYFIQIVWLSYIIASLGFGIIIQDNVEINFFAFMWLYLAIIFFILGSLVVMPVRRLNSAINEFEFILDKAKFKNYFIWIFLFAMSTTVIFMVKNGIDIRVFSDLNMLAKVNHNLAVDRYTSDGSMSSVDRIVTQLDLIFTYSLSLLGGGMLVLSNSQKEKKLFLLLSFLPSVSKFLLTNTKQMLIVAVFFYFLSALAFYLLIYKERPKFNRKLIRNISFIGLIFMFALIFSMSLRSGNIGSDGVQYAFRRVLVYAFGGTYGYDYYFSNELSFNFDYGKSLFGGITQFFDKFSETFQVNNKAGMLMIGDAYYTNIRTVFSQILGSFNVIGGLMFMFYLGAITKIAHSNIVGKRPKPAYICILIANYFFIIHGLFSSPWSYTSLIIPFILLYIVLKRTMKVEKSGARYEKSKICDCTISL